ncbi:hypothetical protein [Pseudomonas syringae]|uniref:hypothetical protein n=1 Tax=Pseudomonas syringae TaxID=317 RepID=UPI003F756540
MATEFLKNGNFIDDLKYWAAPEGFDSEFEPSPGGKGQSIKLNTGVTVSQFIAQLPAPTLHIEFDMLSADLDIDKVLFVIAVGGYNSEGALNLTPVIGLATQEWEHFSGDIPFGEELEKCFVNLSAPSDTSRFSFSNSLLVPLYGPVRFANLSLSLAEVDGEDDGEQD